MMIQSGSRINIDALRMIPYATLVRALVSCFVLISIGTACLSTASETRTWGIYISASFLGILAVLGYALAIDCLCGLLDFSDRFRTTLILLVLAVVLCCVGILTLSEVILQKALNHQQAATAVELIYNILSIIEKIVYSTALFIFMKGLADVLYKSENNSKIVRCLDLLGSIYIAAVVILCVAVSLAYAKDGSYITSFLLISLFVGTVLETVIFVVQRKAAILIWQDHYGRRRAKMGASEKGQG